MLCFLRLHGYIYIYIFCIFTLPDEKDRTLALQTLERKEGVDFDLWRSETKQNKETKNAKREKKILEVLF